MEFLSHCSRFGPCGVLCGCFRGVVGVGVPSSHGAAALPSTLRPFPLPAPMAPWPPSGRHAGPRACRGAVGTSSLRCGHILPAPTRPGRRRIPPLGFRGIRHHPKAKAFRKRTSRIRTHAPAHVTHAQRAHIVRLRRTCACNIGIASPVSFC